MDVSLRAACPMHMCIGRSVKATQPLEVAYSVSWMRCGMHCALCNLFNTRGGLCCVQGAL